MIEDDRLNVSSMYGPKYAFHGAQPVRDGQVIECAGIEVDVLQTPGHTVGGMLLLPTKRTIDCLVEIRCSVLPSEEQTYQQEAAASWYALYRRRS